MTMEELCGLIQLHHGRLLESVKNEVKREEHGPTRTLLQETVDFLEDIKEEVGVDD